MAWIIEKKTQFIFVSQGFETVNQAPSGDDSRKSETGVYSDSLSQAYFML